MVNTGQSDKGQDTVSIMSEPSEADKQNESCAELSGDDNQGEELITAENEECGNAECQPGPSKSNSNEADQSSEENKAVVHSCGKSCEDILDVTQCSENLPSSDSNKENIDSNVLNQSVEFNPDDNTFNGDDYDSDQIPLPQLLKIHVKQLVSGFEYGEATKRRAQENMKSARDKTKNERKSLELAPGETDDQEADKTDLVQPSSSQPVVETEHKTPHSRKRQRLVTKHNLSNSDRDYLYKISRRVPDCIAKYPDCKEVWMYMIFKEEVSLKLRNARLFNDFKSVTPRMRAILLDWLMEVASVYHLRRVTYYLSVDYFDRFLSIRPDIPKSLLQLVGITCLYIAAKVEEIYPPNLAEFSYVCDGACKSKDMVSCELLILNSLGWEVVLTTPTDWLNLYMQLHFKSKDLLQCSLNMDFNRDFIFPQYSAYQFTRASQLMDLMSLDPMFLKFGYSVVAAAAMYYMYGEEVARSVSGLSLKQLRPCVEYMEPFFIILKNAPDPRLESCLGGPHPDDANRMSNAVLKRIQNGPKNENYSFQTHIASMVYFEKATIYRLSRFTHQQEETILKIIGKNKSEIVESEDAEVQNKSENEDDTEEKGKLDKPSEENNGSSSLIDDIDSLAELTKSENENQDLEGNNGDDSLMSLDEIFELILNQDDTQSTNSE